MKIYQIGISVLAAFVLTSASCGGSKKTTKVTKTTTTPKKTEEVVVVEEKSLEAHVNFLATDDLNAALAQAKREKKPVFIDFYTTWCGPCKMMDESVFKDYDVTETLNESAVSLKINAEKGNGPGLRAQYGVTGYPTFLFLDTKGNVLVEHRGTLSIAEFKQKIKTAKWKFSQIQ